MERLSIAVPWNQPSYISANGFDPLYQALLEDNPALEFRALDDTALAGVLAGDRQLHRALIARRERLRGELPPWFSDSAMGRRFLEHVTLDEMALTEEIPCEVELHHTSPLTSGRRPFVLHCETFLPMLRPLLQRSGSLDDIEALRSFYGRLIAADTCLGIFSHVPATLEQFRRFFCNTTIDAKLYSSPIGISERDLSELLAIPRNPRPIPSFLFMGSPDDALDGFVRRGGAVVVRFAELYLRSGRQGRFLLRARRPPDAELSAIGVDVPFLARLDDRQVLWIEDQLSGHEHLRLLGLADFVILPGLELQSVTIMQALAAGAVPIASDTIGADVCIDDGMNGILLKGVRDAIGQANELTGIEVDSMSASAGLDAMVAMRIQKRVEEVLMTPDRFAAMRAAGRETARNRFSGARFRNVLSEAIQRLWRERGGGLRALTSTRSRLLSARGAISNGDWERYFARSSQPRLAIDVGTARVYASRGVYYLVPRAPGIEQCPWEHSTLTLMSRRLLDPYKIRIAVGLESLGEPIFLALNRSWRWVGRFRYLRMRMKEQGKIRLRPYTRLYRHARAAYRFLQRTLAFRSRRLSIRSDLRRRG